MISCRTWVGSQLADLNRLEAAWIRRCRILGKILQWQLKWHVRLWNRLWIEFIIVQFFWFSPINTGEQYSIMDKISDLYIISSSWEDKIGFKVRKAKALRFVDKSTLLKSLGTLCQLRQIDYADHENDSHSLFWMFFDVHFDPLNYLLECTTICQQRV